MQTINLLDGGLAEYNGKTYTLDQMIDLMEKSKSCINKQEIIQRLSNEKIHYVLRDVWRPISFPI